MGELISTNLLPGQKYAIQIRAVQGNKGGEWSPTYTFTAGKDTIPPMHVSNLQGSIVGTSMMLKWDAPTQNTDGTSLLDFSNYLVYVTDGVYFAEFSTTDTNFEFTLEMNQDVFGGNAEGDVTFTVYAVDKDGNYDPSAPSVTLMATPPPPISNLAASAQQDAIQVQFDAPTSGTWGYYEVFFSTASNSGPWTSVYKGNGTNLFISDTNYVPTWVSVDTVNVFNLHTKVVDPVSVTPRSSFVVDTTPPAAPTGFSVTGSVDSSDVGTIIGNATWSQTIPAQNDLAGFNIRYQRTSDTVWNYINISDPGARSATVKGLYAGSAYTFQINSFDFTGNTSGWVAMTMSAINDVTPPSTPAAPIVAASTMLIQVTIPGTNASGGAMESDVDHYEVYASNTSGFTPTNAWLAGLVPVGPTMIGSWIIPASAGSGTSQTWYAKIIAVDYSGNKSPASAQSSGSVSLIAGINIQDATITNAKVSDLAADKITAGLGIINALNINNTLTINSAGTLQSSNWSSGIAGYRLANNTLEINQGTIKAAALQLQIGANMVPNQYADFEWQSTFYTNQITIVTNTPTITIDNAHVYYGNQALKIVSAAANTIIDFTPSSAFNIAVEPSTTYILSMYVYALGGGIAVTFTDNGTGSVQQTGSTVSPTPNTWTRISYTFTTSATASMAKVGVGVGINTFWIDGVQLEKQIAGLNTPSQWRPSGLTSINGGIITTGSIQSTNLVSTGQSTGTQPQWAINMAGNATFANALVRGHLIVGDTSGNGVTTDQYLSSPGYSTSALSGAGGWIIRGDGYAEFARAALVGSAGNITLTVGTGPNVLKVDSNGLYMGAATFGAAPFSVDYSGNGYFRGNVTITNTIPGAVVSGTVASATSAGSATNASNLTGGTVSGNNSISGLLNVGGIGANNRVDVGTYGGTSGVQLYGPDPVTGAAGTLLVDLNTNGTSTFKGTILSSVFATSLTGTRVRMEPSGAYGNQIQFWGGGVGETGPGTIYGGNSFLLGDILGLSSPTTTGTNASNAGVLVIAPGSPSYPSGIVYTGATAIRTDSTLEVNGSIIGSMTIYSPTISSPSITANMNVNGNPINGVGQLNNGGGGISMSGVLTITGSGDLTLSGSGATLNVANAPTETTSQPNAYIGPGGRLNKYTGTSWAIDKQQVTKLEEDENHIDRILSLTPVRYKYKNHIASDWNVKHHFGLMLDDLVKSDFRELISFDTNGKPEAVNYDRVGVALLPIVKILWNRIEELESKLTGAKQ